MKDSIKEAKKWAKWFDNISDLDDRVTIFSSKLKEGIDEDFFYEVDVERIVIHLLEYMIDTAQFDDLYELYDLAHRYIDYYDNFVYTDAICIDYAIHTNDEKRILAHLDSYLNDLDKNYDFLLPVLDKLVNSGHNEMVMKIANDIFDKVKESNKLIGGAEYDLFDYLYPEKLLEAYIKVENKEEVDTNEIVKWFNKYGSELELYEMERQIELWKSKDDYEITDLGFVFSDLFGFFISYMKKSNIRPKTLLEIHTICYETYKGNLKHYLEDKDLDSLFELDREKYKDSIYYRLDPLFSNQTTAAFNAAFGSYYYYEFLYNYKLISKDVYTSAIEIIDEVRIMVYIEYVNDLWKYTYITNWPKPLELDDDIYNSYIEDFELSFRIHIEFDDDYDDEDLE